MENKKKRRREGGRGKKRKIAEGRIQVRRMGRYERKKIGIREGAGRKMKDEMD